VALATSVSEIAVGFPDGINKPSAFSPATARTERSSCGVVPRNVARYGRPRSAAILLKYAVAMTLFAAPCSHTKITDGDRVADCMSANNSAPTTGTIRPPSAPRRRESRLSDCHDMVLPHTAGADFGSPAGMARPGASDTTLLPVIRRRRGRR